jgi:hypothetical protein
VTTPRSVELNEHVLGVIENDILVGVCDHNSDSVLLLLGNGLRLDARRQLALDKVLDERHDLLLSELVAFQGILLVLGDFLDGESGERIGREVEVASVSAKSFGVNDGHVQLALVLLGNRLQVSCELSALFRGLGEDVC